MTNDALLLRAARGERTERTPVWMMRQAGRYLSDYRAIRAEVSFMELCRRPDLAIEVSLQPWRILGVDGVIMFSDILVPLVAMGARVDYPAGGPRIAAPVRTMADVEALVVPDPVETMPFVFETLRGLRRQLDGAVPVIGFAGAPWTMACYLVDGGGSRQYPRTKAMALEAPDVLHALLDKIAATVTAYLEASIEAGAEMVQLFDTWAGELTPAGYDAFAQPYHERIFGALEGRGVPRVLYVNNTAPFLERMARSGADMLSIDWRVDLAEARRRVGPAVALQGNVDPCALLGPPAQIRRIARETIDKGGRQGHVLNLGHGILRQTPVEHARAFVDTGKTYRGTSSR